MKTWSLTSASLAVGVCFLGGAGAVSADDDAHEHSWCLRPPMGLTAWWPGDGNANDLVGGRNAELHANASFGLAYVDQGFLLHGDGDGDGDGDFVSVSDDSALNFGKGDFTIDLWAFFSDPGAGEQVLIEKYIQGFSSPSDGWTFTKLSGNQLLLVIEGNDGPQGAQSEPVPIPAGTWTHFAATRRAGLISLFVNGRRVASSFYAAGNFEADSLASLKLGHRGNPNDTPGSEDGRQFYLDGGIDEAEMFVGRALTGWEIWAIYSAGHRGKCKD